MSTRLGFKIVENYGEGKVVIATKDFLPGEVVFREEPLLHLSDERMEAMAQRYQKLELFGMERVIWASEKSFRRDLSSKQKEIFLSLHHPTSGQTSDDTRSIVQNMVKLNKWDEKKIETFTKIALIYHFNAFSVKGTRRVYEYCSRINHSCRANCRIDFPSGDNVHAIWTAVSPIREGDEMTITYGAHLFDFKSTNDRIDYYLWSKEFLCECPRCCLLGDDTRQFNCCNTACNGRHLAAQSSSESAPYLLNCNKCRATPRQAFQEEMFSWERCSEDHKNQTVGLVARGKAGETHALTYPDCHIKSCSLSYALFERASLPSAKLTLAKRFVKPIDLLVLPPNVQHCEWFTQAADMFLKTRTSEGLIHSRNYARKALRDFKIMFGRNTLRSESAEAVLCSAMSCMPPENNDLNICMFCGESPLRACLVLNLCGHCKKVTYCGARCQTEHWRFHKPTCVGTRKTRRVGSAKGVRHDLFGEYIVETL